MANMTSSHYQVVADVIAQAKADVELLKNRFVEERAGDYVRKMVDGYKEGMTYGQYLTILSARTTLADLGKAMKEAFSNEYANFNEDRFNKAIGGKE